MTLFFAEELSPAGGKLGPEESHHASRVLRHQPGDQLLVTRGEGIIYQAHFTVLTKKEAHFSIDSINRKEERPNYLHIAIAPTKSNDRFETFLEKATEAGIDEITPIISHHSERRVYKTARGLKIIQAAAKQSLACWWPRLNEPIDFEEFLKNREEEQGKRYIAHCAPGDKQNALAKLAAESRVTMLIGPEGDFSEGEVKSALAKGFVAASLGPKRLRTETAGIAVAFAHKLLGK